MMLRRKFEDASSVEVFRRVREMDWYSGTILSAPRYDPILTPLLTSIGLTGSITIGTTGSITYASIASAIITTAGSIGLQMLLQKTPDVASGHVPKTEPVSYRSWIVGRTRVSGAYMLWEAKGTHLFSVQAIAGHKIQSVNRYWLHSDEVELGPDNRTTNDDDGRYSNNVLILHRLGNNPETAYSELVDYLGASGVWTNTHRGDGQASVAMMCTQRNEKHQQTCFPYGAPQLSVEADGAIVWDFRIDADPSNPAAWVWTQNSILILAWHLCFNEFGYQRNYRTAILPVLADWIEEADICDEDVATAAGGTEKRYQCNGFDTTENGPKSGLGSILATCDGWLCERGDGALIPLVGKFRETKVQVVTDADIVGHQVQYNVLFEDECNRLIPKFTYPSTDYTSTTTDYFEDSDAQASAGRVLSQEGDYAWCHQWRQARRLGKRDWLRYREKVRGSLRVRLSGMNAVYSRWIRLDTPIRLPKLNGKLIENRKATLSLTEGGFTMDFIQHPDNIDAWDPATDEGLMPPVPSVPDDDGYTAPVIYSLVAKSTGSSVYLEIKLVDPGKEVTPRIRYRLDDVGDGSPGDWVYQSFDSAVAVDGYITIATGAVPSDTVLDLEASYKSSSDDDAFWSTPETVATTVDPTPADPATGVSVSPGTGNATINWYAPNSANYAGARIYWNTVDNFSTASAISPPTYGSPGAFASTLITLAAGDKYAWVVSLNRSGVESTTPVPTGVFTVL